MEGTDTYVWAVCFAYELGGTDFTAIHIRMPIQCFDETRTLFRFHIFKDNSGNI